MKVKCLTPGGLYCVEGTTDNGEIDCDRGTEISRRHSRLHSRNRRPEQIKESNRWGSISEWHLLNS